jgi:molecular chaperone DnaJ
MAQATLGAEIEVPTLDGQVKYNISPGTQTGTRFRLRGKGVPHLNHNKSRGDQYVDVNIETPTKLTNEQRELFEKLAESFGETVTKKKKGFFK